MKVEHRAGNEETQSYLCSAQQNNEKIEPQEDLSGDCLAFYKMKSDEQLYQYLRGIAEQLGRAPTKAEVPGFHHIKARLGSWPRILEKAGIKPMSEKRRYKLKRRAQARKEKFRKKTAGKTNRHSTVQEPV